jgi:hypothetical protein
MTVSYIRGELPAMVDTSRDGLVEEDVVRRIDGVIVKSKMECKANSPPCSRKTGLEGTRMYSFLPNHQGNWIFGEQ